MKRTNLKMLALATAAVAGLALLPQGAQAQTPVQTSIATNSAITVVDGDDIDFGTWLIIVRSGETPTLTIDSTATVTVAGDTTSTVQDLGVGTQQAGTLTVDVPAGSNNVVLQMERTAATAFTDGGLTLTNAFYSTATEGADVAFPEATGVDVTVVAGGTPETVTFGVEITANATPDDANSPHTSSFDVTFAY